MGLGAQIRECEKGPQAMMPEIEALFPPEEGDVLSRIHVFNERLAERVSEILDVGEFPIVIGGDHSVAIGTWNGVGRSLEGPLSLIWIDAHLDGHTMETSPSNAIHGMPLAALLGHGDEKLSKLIVDTPVLNPENLFIVGARSYEEGELALFKKLGVQIYWIDEVLKRGIADVLSEVLGKIKTPHLGLSIDLDVIDPEEAPGVGSKEDNGVCSEDLIASLDLFKERLSAFELVEYNPDLDFENKTREIAGKLLDKIMDQQLVI